MHAYSVKEIIKVLVDTYIQKFARKINVLQTDWNMDCWHV